MRPSPMRPSPMRPSPRSPEFGTRDEATEWMERERLNLDAMIMDAVRRDRAAVAAALPAAMHAFLRFHGHWDHALRAAQDRADAAIRIGDERAEASALTNLGDMQLAARDYPAAAASLSRRDPGLPQPAATGGARRPRLTQLGAALYLTGDNQTAAVHLRSGPGAVLRAG